MDNDPDAKGKIEPELARANLFRMRGDYEGAVEQCLSILKHLPEDVDTHVLLGDIFAEKGDLTQAEPWYELALELDPKNVPIQSKLLTLRERVSYREIAETAEQLGLPPEGSRLAMMGGGLVAVIVVIGFIAFLIGQHNPAPRTIHVPVIAGGTGDSGNVDSGIDSSDPSTKGPNAILSVVQLPQDDRTLTSALSQRLPLGTHLIDAMQDPRTKVLTLTYSVRPDEDPRVIAAQLARSAFDQNADLISAVLRGVREDRVIYMADVSRSKVSQTETPAWQSENSGSSSAWIDYVLSDEWTSNPTESSAPSQSTPVGTTEGSNSGGATSSGQTPSGSTGGTSGGSSQGSGASMPSASSTGTALTGSAGGTTAASDSTTGSGAGSGMGSSTGQ